MPQRPDDCFSPPYAFRARWMELHRDGFVEFHSPGVWRVTAKGFAVLMAEAERKSVPKKTSVEFERRCSARSRET